MKLISFIGAGAFIVLSACAMQKDVTKDQQTLYDTKWSLKKIHSAGTTENVNTKAFIRFIKEKESAGGNGSCNSFGSTAVVKDYTVSITNVISTKMYCEGVQQIENAFFDQLSKVTRFEIKDSSLLLYRDKEVLLEFDAASE